MLDYLLPEKISNYIQTNQKRRFWGKNVHSQQRKSKV